MHTAKALFVYSRDVCHGIDLICRLSLSHSNSEHEVSAETVNVLHTTDDLT